jgi:hypothetical protein
MGTPGGPVIPKLAFGAPPTAGQPKLSLNIPQLQIPSLNMAAKDQNKKDAFGTPQIASTPLNELLNVMIILH